MEGSTGFEQGADFSEKGMFRSFSDDGLGSDHIRSIYRKNFARVFLPVDDQNLV